MKLRVRACGSALGVGLSVLAGCGGNVVLDHGTGGAAGGGAGGTITITTTTPTTTTTTPTTTTTTPTTTTTTITTTTTTITSTTSSTNTWSGMSSCDNTGNCGDGQNNGCIACSFQSDCAEPYNTCTSGNECIDFSNCINNCGGTPDCNDTCAAENPVGAQQYTDLVYCVICWDCYNDCNGISAGCPN